jgi:hypothetical protein
MLLNARRICGKDNQTEFILLAIEDMTERRLAEEAKREIELVDVTNQDALNEKVIQPLHAMIEADVNSQSQAGKLK